MRDVIASSLRSYKSRPRAQPGRLVGEGRQQPCQAQDDSPDSFDRAIAAGP
jgi:hypothetical protein